MNPREYIEFLGKIEKLKCNTRHSWTSSGRREIGLDKVLITCINGNIGSEKTILANGGVYEYTVYEPNKKEYLKRFWITL